MGLHRFTTSPSSGRRTGGYAKRSQITPPEWVSDLRAVHNGHALGLPGQVPGTVLGMGSSLRRRIWP